MLTFLTFLFRLPAMYRLLGFPRALYFKYSLMMGGYTLHWILLGFSCLLTPHIIYIPCMLMAMYIVQSYDVSSGGLITQLHEAGIFGTWRQASRVATCSVYGIIFLHFTGGTLLF